MIDYLDDAEPLGGYEPQLDERAQSERRLAEIWNEFRRSGYWPEGEPDALTKDALEKRVKELEAELYRARTDSRYWDEHNTISRHDAIRNRNDALEAENAAMIHQSGEALGTDESLCSSTCVEALCDHVEWLRKEIAELRQQLERAREMYQRDAK
jgi:hypothetical protein